MNMTIRDEARKVVKMFYSFCNVDNKPKGRDVDAVVRLMLKGVSSGVLVAVLKHFVETGQEVDLHKMSFYKPRELDKVFRKIDVEKKFDMNKHADYKDAADNKKVVEVAEKRLKEVEKLINKENPDVILVEEEARLKEIIEEAGS